MSYVIVLTLTRANTIYLNDKSLTMGQLQEDLWKQMKQGENCTLCLKIDKAVPYAQVIYVFEVIKRLDVYSVSLVVRGRDWPDERLVPVHLLTWSPPVVP